MTKKIQAWKPDYTITNKIIRGLMAIEGAKTAVENIRLSPDVEIELRDRTRLKSTYYSTKIDTEHELKYREVEEIIEGACTEFPGKEKDVKDVKNYWDALIEVGNWAEWGEPFSVELIRRIHNIVINGDQVILVPYRKGRKGKEMGSGLGSAHLNFFWAKAEEIPLYIDEMVRWKNEAERNHIPGPIIAGLVFNRFISINPFSNRNHRTAHLMVSFILQQNGYGLKGFLSTENQYSKDIEKYYRSHEIYYNYDEDEDRMVLDLTPWLEYFIETLAYTFIGLKNEAKFYELKMDLPPQPEELRRLDFREKIILAQFIDKDEITLSDISGFLDSSTRMVQLLVTKWVEKGWLVVKNPSKRARSYCLSATYRQYIDSFSAMKSENNGEQEVK